MQPEECIFCKIVRGEIPSTKIYEDEKVVVFKDINPQSPVHLLIVPKEHLEPYTEGFVGAGKEIPGALFHAAEEAAKLQRISASGFRLIVNVGPDAGQEVSHLHMHLLGGAPLGRLVSKGS